MQPRYQAQAGFAPSAAVNAPAATREKFITQTYLHLFGAIALFTAIEVALFQSGVAVPIALAMSQSWWMVMLGFVGVSWVASRAAHQATSLPAQYLALAGFVLVWAVMFVPLMVIANIYAPGAIQSAAVTTMLGFAGLTGVAFWTKKDFSFLGSVIKWGMICSLALIVAGLIFGFHLGTFFSVGMVALAGAAILYDTSNVLHHFPTNRYVGAALQLFSSVALMFWYVLRLFIAARD